MIVFLARFYRPLTFLLLVFFSAQNNFAADAIKISPQQTNDGYDFYIENTGDIPYKVRVDVELTNMTSDADFPYVDIVGGNDKKLAFKVWRADASKNSSYKFSYRWRRAFFRSSSCVDGVFCIVTEMRGDSLVFYLENTQFVPVSVKFVPDGFRNLQTNQKMPFTKAYGGHKKSKMFTAWLADDWSGWDQGFQYQWQYGIAGIKHNNTYAYALPYEQGKKFEMIQGENGSYSHQGKNAYDWQMPESTPISAARDGVVIAVVENYEVGGSAEELKKAANVVEIMHLDGSIGRYSHLRKNGALVQVGDRIARGQKIALSGNTGYSTGPHLHFEVLTLTNDLEFESVPLTFRVAEKKTARLQEGDFYKAFE